MYAVLKTGGKQYRVEKEDVVLVEKLDVDEDLANMLISNGFDSLESISSSSTDCPRIAANESTLGSWPSLTFSSERIERALCQSPLSIKHRATAIRGRTPSGSARTS